MQGTHRKGEHMEIKNSVTDIRERPNNKRSNSSRR